MSGSGSAVGWYSRSFAEPLLRPPAEPPAEPILTLGDRWIIGLGSAVRQANADFFCRRFAFYQLFGAFGFNAIVRRNRDRFFVENQGWERFMSRIVLIINSLET